MINKVITTGISSRKPFSKVKPGPTTQVIPDDTWPYELKMEPLALVGYMGDGAIRPSHLGYQTAIPIDLVHDEPDVVYPPPRFHIDEHDPVREFGEQEYGLWSSTDPAGFRPWVMTGMHNYANIDNRNQTAPWVITTRYYADKKHSAVSLWRYNMDRQGLSYLMLIVGHRKEDGLPCVQLRYRYLNGDTRTTFWKVLDKWALPNENSMLSHRLITVVEQGKVSLYSEVGSITTFIDYFTLVTPIDIYEGAFLEMFKPISRTDDGNFEHEYVNQMPNWFGLHTFSMKREIFDFVP